MGRLLLRGMPAAAGLPISAIAGDLTIKPVTIAEWKAVYGQFEARDRVGGIVMELKVTEGESIKAGDVVAVVMAGEAVANIGGGGFFCGWPFQNGTRSFASWEGPSRSMPAAGPCPARLPKATLRSKAAVSLPMLGRKTSGHERQTICRRTDFDASQRSDGHAGLCLSGPQSGQPAVAEGDNSLEAFFSRLVQAAG